jgi:tetratricopeptide (TPR) repeat protein
MKNLKQILIILLLFTISAGLFAEDFLVVFTQGSVKVKSGAGFKPVVIGDSLAPASVVKLERGGMLELSLDSGTITLYEAGTYTLKDLQKKSKEEKSESFLSAVDARIKNMVQGNNYHRTSAAGLRGFEQGQKGNDFNDMEWPVEKDESEIDPITQGQNLLAQNKYDEAIVHFEKMLAEWKYPEAKPFFSYYLAYAHAQKGEKAKALKLLDQMPLTPGHILYADYTMLKGRLLLESFAYKSALEIFEQYLAQNSRGENTQAVLLLASYCSKGLGNKAKQKEYLLKAKELDAESLLGKEADKLLKEM